MTTVRDAALSALDAGISIIPILADGSKRPPFAWSAFQSDLPSEQQVRGWFGPHTGYAMICGAVSGNLEPLDFDDADTYQLFLDTAEALGLGPLVDRIRAGYEERTPGGGAHLPYYCSVVAGNTKLAKNEVGVAIIETRGSGGYVIAAPSNGGVHPTGGAWVLTCGDVSTIATITPEERATLHALARSFDRSLPKDDPTSTPQSTKMNGETARPGDDYRERHRALSAFQSIVEAHGWQLVHRRGETGYFRRPGKDDGWSATYNHAGSGLFYVFSSSTLFEPERGYNPFSVYALLNHGGDFRAAAGELARSGHGDSRQVFATAVIDTKPIHEGAFALTDMGNGERLIWDHGRDVRHCHAWSKWLVWDGTRFAADDCGAINARAKTTVRAIYGEAASEPDEDRRKALAKHAKASEAANRIAAMLDLARSEPGVPVRPDALDVDPWQLNCPNGTIDLRTGALRAHDPADLITKRVPVPYLPDAPCSRWLQFLDRIFASDAGVISFVQRALGSSLTGITRDRVLFILHGSGRNGKSTLIEVVRAVLGPDYAVRTPTDTLLTKRDSGIPNDIAKLRGARFVSAAEADEGRRLAEATVKDLTGGDTISARFMRSEFFEFTPEFKLWFGTNHRPEVRGTDSAIWDRIRLIPFSVRFVTADEDPHAAPEFQVDLELREKLIKEGPGILSWMVCGCLDWQRNGLGFPKTVRDATSGYRADMDLVGSFLDDHCIVHPGARVSSGTLYRAFEEWEKASGEKHTTSQRALAIRLKERGIESAHGRKGTIWIGVGLKNEDGTYVQESSL